MKYFSLKFVVIISCVCFFNNFAIGEIPKTMNYQGYLVDSSGNAVNDTVNMTFTLYDAITGGQDYWQETVSVNVSSGIYSVVLGQTIPLDIDFTIPYFLGIKVGNDNEMSPRQPLSSVPYALNVGDGAFTGSGSNLIYTGGNVGIGTNNPEAKLTIDDVNEGDTAIKVVSPNTYFDYNAGMIFRGTGDYYATHFTSTNNLQDDGQVVGIFTEEPTDGQPGNPLAVFLNNGNVGIGTDNPQGKLTVYGGGGNSPSFVDLHPGVIGDDAWFDFQGTCPPDFLFRIRSNHGRGDEGELDGIPVFLVDRYLDFEDDTSENLFAVMHGGKIGIGTTNPEAKFTIDEVAEGDTAIKVVSANTYFDYNGGMIFRGTGSDWATHFTSTSDLHENGEVVGIYQEETVDGQLGEPIATFLNNGHVGINTSNPFSNFVVIGSSNFIGSSDFLRNGIVSGVVTPGNPNPNQAIAFRAELQGNPSDTEGAYDAFTAIDVNDGGGDGWFTGFRVEGGYDTAIEIQSGFIDYITGIDLTFRNDGGEVLTLGNNGNVGIGTTSPSEKLEVMGNVKADQFLTGDIVFHEDNIKPVWRMYEDEKGLYVQSLTTQKKYSVVLKEIVHEGGDTATLDKNLELINTLQTENKKLEQRLAKIEELLSQM